MAADLGDSRRHLAAFRAYRGSALDLRRLHSLDDRSAPLEDASYDMALFSPPFLNNFDYAEVYKVELWLLGYLHDLAGWRELRRGSVRSHHSLRPLASGALAASGRHTQLACLVEQLAGSPLLTGYARENMPPVIKAYFDDTLEYFTELWRVVRPGGFVIYHVANSRHAWLPIATDLLIAEVASGLGFEKVALLTLKRRNGRTKAKHVLRDSATILRRP